METDIYAPLLRGEGVKMDGKWNTLLAGGQLKPETVPAQKRKYVDGSPV